MRRAAHALWLQVNGSDDGAGPAHNARVLACLLVLPTLAGAQQPTHEQVRPAQPDTRQVQISEAQLDQTTVVITATRTAQSAFDVPAAIDSVSGDTVREHRLRVNLSEALGRVPGLNINNRFNYAQDLQVSSRGFGARASFGVRGVRLLQDGIPLTMPDGQGQTGLFDLDAVDRVEVLRGPFAALYGNASGGVVQLVTAAARAPRVELSTTFADDATRRYALQGSTRFGAWDVAANVSRFETRGFRAHSRAEREVANLRLGYRRDDGSTLTILGSYLDQPDTQDPLGLTREQFASDPNQPATNAIELNSRKSTRHLQGGLAYEEVVSEASRVRAVLYGGNRDVRQFLANPSTALTGSGGVVDLAREFGGASLQWSHEGTLLKRPFDFVLGAEYDRMDERRRGFVNAGGLLGALRRDEDNDVYAVNQYALAQWQATPDWRLSAGVRHSDVRFAVDDFFVTGPNPDDSGSLSFASTQPVVGVQWSPAAMVTVFASGGRAFETPTFAELAYRPGNLPGLNLALRAAVSENLEAGAKLRVGERSRVTLTLFRSQTENDIVTGPSPAAGRNTFVNARQTLRRGAEVALQASSDSGLETHLAYTYTKARFEEFVNFAGLDLGGNAIPGVPKHSAYAELLWRHAPTGLTTGIEARWVDRVFADDANTASADAYFTVGAHIGLRQQFDGWSLREFVRIENLADERYAGSVIVNAVNARFFEPAPGRTVYLGVVAEFSL
jgi:iron complex outermembrane recepter protein